MEEFYRSVVLLKTKTASSGKGSASEESGSPDFGRRLSSFRDQGCNRAISEPVLIS